MLEAAEYPDGFPHSWRLAYAAASGHLAIEYEFPRVDLVPTDKAYKYVKSSDTITPSARPPAQIRSIYTEVLRQTEREADTFAAELLTPAEAITSCCRNGSTWPPWRP